VRPGNSTTRLWQLAGAAILLAAPSWALSHGCEPLDKYLVGHYHGECDSETELAQGVGEAKGADRYEGQFLKGLPDGRGKYAWENGARLEGSFKDGKAHGKGVYVSAAGVRYEGPFVMGKLEAIKRSDCPVTPGPVKC
jgi:hypothetical protein